METKKACDPQREIVRQVLEEAERSRNPGAEEAHRMVTKVTPTEAAKLMDAVNDQTRYVIGSHETVSEDLSPENQAFLEREEFRTNYAQSSNRLKKEGKEKGMPTLEEAMTTVRGFGNKRLDALRARCWKPVLVVAEKMTFADLQKRKDERRIHCDDVNDPIFFGGKPPGAGGFSVGIVEGFGKPKFFREDNNPLNYLGIRYDAAYKALEEDGLRSPQGPEQIALLEVLKAENIIIDRDGCTLLDIGKREKKAQVPFTLGNSLFKHPPDNQMNFVHLRPSAWGDHVLKS
jgi:hypothetical protein